MNWRHNFFTWAWILRMFYISGTTFTLFQQDLIFSSLGSPIWNCPFNIREHTSNRQCHLCKFELNSCEKRIQTNNLNTDLRYLSVSGCIVPQAIRLYPDMYSHSGNYMQKVTTDKAHISVALVKVSYVVSSEYYFLN